MRLGIPFYFDGLIYMFAHAERRNEVINIIIYLYVCMRNMRMGKLHWTVLAELRRDTERPEDIDTYHNEYEKC